MGSCLCKPQFQEKILLRAVYPVNPNDNINYGDIDRLTMYAIRHPEKLITIGKKIEKYVNRDLVAKKYSSVMMSMKVLDAVITSCNSELSIFIVHVVNVVKVLLEHENVELKIKSIETVRYCCKNNIS